MGYSVINADVLEWAKNYDGPKSHALLCDPPYHLTSIVKRFGKNGSAPVKVDEFFDGNGNNKGSSPYKRTSTGFMGQTWDGGDIAFRSETWAALAEHLYPGAFLIAFAGSRGWHRQAVAMEDAGLIMHPTIFNWAFGCLSEDTEILTDSGWKSYRDICAGSMVMCYNVTTEALDYAPVEKIYEYDYNDTAYRIHSDNTDQLVSRNHRCLVERGGKFVFRQAETLERQESVPVLEGVSNLPEDILGWKLGRVLQKEPLFSDMRHGEFQIVQGREIARLPEESESRSTAKEIGKDNNLSRLWQAGLQTCGMVAKSKITNLFPKLQRKVEGEGVCQARLQGESGVDRGERKEFQPKNVWGKQSGMEGWSNLFSQAWQLCADKIRSLSSGILGHGPQRLLCYGASPNSSATDWPVAIENRGGASQRPQSAEQRTTKPDAVFKQLSAQELRASWIPVTDLATVTPVHYVGKVWCVKVPTGAFVARRNGKIFITGNSGFPKATRIDSQVDRQAGAEREPVGEYIARGFSEVSPSEDGRNMWGAGEVIDKPTVITKPSTPLAQAWEGHRYGLQALKPAVEPILIFQVPYSGRPVDNITSTGAGALNIDGARIGTSELSGNVYNNRLRHGNDIYGNGNGIPQTTLTGNPNGRWPANFALSHTDRCRIVGQREQKGYTINRFNDGAKPFGGGAGHEYNTTEMGGGTESVWECAEDCAVLKLNEQSGVSKSTGGRAGHTAAYGGGYKQEHYGDESPGLGDVGGASRFFFNSDWNAEVEERLFNSDPVRYQAKAGRKERDAGLGEMPARKMPRLEGDTRPNHQEDGLAFDGKEQTLVHNSHPTVKPIALCKWLATLLLPPDMYAPRRLLIPFSGVGSEMIGAIQAGWEDVTGIEAESEYIPIAEARLKYWSGKMNIKSLPLFDHE